MVYTRRMRPDEVRSAHAGALAALGDMEDPRAALHDLSTVLSGTGKASDEDGAPAEVRAFMREEPRYDNTQHAGTLPARR